MNLKINCDICVLEEQEINDIEVFNLFFHSNSKIVYTVDAQKRLTGVITVNYFLEHLKIGNTNYINRNYSQVSEKENAKEMFDEAEKLMNRYHITTAIPVINKNGKIIYDISIIHIESEKSILFNYNKKFMKYCKSKYLKEEIFYLRRVLREQKIIIIGKEEKIENFFGDLFENKYNLIFIDDNRIENAYEFLQKCNDLIIDLTISNHEGRTCIYDYCHNGFGWKTFWNLLLLNIEQEECSRLYRVIEQNEDLLKDILDKYEEKLFVQVNNLLKAIVIKYFNLKGYYLKSEEELFKEEYYRYPLVKDNKKNLTKKKETFWNIIEIVDTNIRYTELYLNYQDEVKILNFICDAELLLLENEKKRMGNKAAVNKYIDEMQRTKNCIFNLNSKSENYIKKFFNNNTYFKNRRCYENDLILFDDQVGLVNIENGIRKTCDQPEKYVGSVYFIGMCTIYGSIVEDKYTIPSIIQKKINKSGKKYRVINLGNTVTMNPHRLVKKFQIGKNDIIVILFPAIAQEIKRKIPIIEIGEEINKIRQKKYKGKEIYLDMPQHVGDYGSEIYADAIFKELKVCLSVAEEGALIENNIYNLFERDYSDLDCLYDFGKFISEIRRIKKNSPTGAQNIGCIVMNCNPFTLGHRYLIEYALMQMDYLYIFVVEEEKSYFSFHDRYEMVLKGTSDLKNLSVLRSGKTILSSVTFSQYFENKYRKEQQTKKVSSIVDLRVFAQYIAPELNINYRFVGEEPLDQITFQYNQTMKDVLPKFGINVIEIPRKYINDKEIISASKVRTKFIKGEFKQFQDMVPKTTLYYLNKIRGEYCDKNGRGKGVVHDNY